MLCVHYPRSHNSLVKWALSSLQMRSQGSERVRRDAQVSGFTPGADWPRPDLPLDCTAPFQYEHLSGFLGIPFKNDASLLCGQQGSDYLFVSFQVIRDCFDSLSPPPPKRFSNLRGLCSWCSLLFWSTHSWQLFLGAFSQGLLFLTL